MRGAHGRIPCLNSQTRKAAMSKLRVRMSVPEEERSGSLKGIETTRLCPCRFPDLRPLGVRFANLPPVSESIGLIGWNI